MSFYDNIVLLYASNTELFLSKSSSLPKKHFQAYFSTKITEFSVFGDIIFDVTGNTMFTNDNAGNALK